MFKDKTLFISGGTGSFGNAVIEKFLNTGIKETRIFSRDEKKQDDMRNVIASRGSVIPLFVKQIKEGAPLTVTDPNVPCRFGKDAALESTLISMN